MAPGPFVDLDGPRGRQPQCFCGPGRPGGRARGYGGEPPLPFFLAKFPRVAGAATGQVTRRTGRLQDGRAKTVAVLPFPRNIRTPLFKGLLRTTNSMFIWPGFELVLDSWGKQSA